jgi:hypothetical protein
VTMHWHAMEFSTDAVLGLLAHRKSQTRRLVSNASSLVDGYTRRCAWWRELDFAGEIVIDQGPSPAGNPGPYLKVERRGREQSRHRIYPRWQPGDRIWVREEWRTEERESDGVDGVCFRADKTFLPIANTKDAADKWFDAHHQGERKHPGRIGRWRQRRAMPRWASRIQLEVTAVRTERLQSISDDDALAEGPRPAPGGGFWAPNAFSPGARDAFRYQWQHDYGERAEWRSNPWVWPLTFHIIEVRHG